jgi:CheY-like chemotaxis protein
MKKIVLILLCLTGASVFSIVFAQDIINSKTVDELFEMNLDKFLKVVITLSKLPQSESSATQKVDLIDETEIETTVSGNRNICEAISKLPGTSVSVLSRNDANWGTYGGIGKKYSTYMLQGLPIDAFIDPLSLDYLFGRNKFADRTLFPMPNLILLDLKMPDIDGFEVLCQIKNTDKIKRIPVVIITSSKEEGDCALSYDIGANSYLLKPVLFHGFIDVVKKINDYWLTLNIGAPEG